MGRERWNSKGTPAASSPPAPRTLGASTKKRAKQGTASPSTGATPAAAVLESTTEKERTTAPSTNVTGNRPRKACSVAPKRKGEPVLRQSDSSRTDTKTATVHSPPSTTLPTSSSYLLPSTLKGMGTRRRTGSVTTSCSTATEPLVPAPIPRSTHSADASSSAPAIGPEVLSCAEGKAPRKSVSAGCGSRGVPTTKRRGKHRSTGLLPAVRNNKDIAVVAVQAQSSDESTKPEESAPSLRSVTTSDIALAYPIGALGGGSIDGLTGAVIDELPPLRSLHGAETKRDDGSHSPPWVRLHKTPINTDSHCSPPLAPLRNIRTPSGSASSKSLAVSPLLSKLVDIPSPARKWNSGVITDASLRGGGVVEDQRVQRCAPTSPPQRNTAYCGEVGVGAMEANWAGTSNALGKATAGRVGNQKGAEEGDDETSSEHEDDDEAESSEGDDEGEGSDYNEVGTSDEDEDEDDADTDDRSVDDEEDEEDESTSASSSSSDSSAAATKISSRRSRKKKRKGTKWTQNVLMSEKDTTTLSWASTEAQWRGGPASAAQQIRTKVSREGDVNVKVIFAVRSRHSFRCYIKEVMTRFGFQKATDFDMYCIDQYGDRVDIDTREDFEQLLDAFTETMSAGKESLMGSPGPQIFRPPSMVPLYQLCDANQNTGSCGVPGATDGLNMSDHAREQAVTFNASKNYTSSFYAAKSFSLSPRLDTTLPLAMSNGSLMDDDGKSSGSVLRLYVRYSNAYYTEHRQEFEQQMKQSLLYPQGMPSAAPFFTNQQQQQLSLGSPLNKWRLQPDPLPSGHASPGVTGSPSARSHPSMTAGNGCSGGGEGGSALNYDEINTAHGQSSDWTSASPNSVSMHFNETLNSNMTKTLRIDEAEPLEWRRMGVLGKGSFGTVYEGITQDGRMLAVKVQELTLDDGEDAEAVKALKTEINLMRSLKHKNIVAYYGCQTRVLPTGNQQMEVFLELCHGGSLASLRRKFVKAKEPFSISLVRSYTRQVLEGLSYLHAQNVVHRDIKSDNVLISAMGEAKLADFGCSKRLGPATLQGMPATLPPGAAPEAPSPQEAATTRAAMYQTVVGSPFFMAPEVLREDGSYTGAADIWSVGCLVLELLGREPWDITGKNIFQIMFRISKEKGMPTGVPKKCPAMLLDFLERCFQRDTKQRATAVELLAHEWLTCPDRVLEEVPPSPLSQE